MTSLIICEKPSVAKDIAKALNVRNKKTGFYENSQYIITWAMGHLVTLASPKKYHLKYEQWNLDDLPIIPLPLKYEIIKSSAKQFYTIKRLIYDKRVKEIIIATDAGREGELVARLILLQAQNKKPLKRLWISSVTPQAIRDGFKNLKQASKYQGLYESAIARAYADWVVGINATRALTTKYNASLSCGRVQTPTLHLVYNQEQKLKNFHPKTYYSIKVVCQDLEFVFQTDNQFKLDYMQKIHEKIKNKQELVISDVKEKVLREYPEALYDLTRLQIEANQKFNFSPKKTLNIVQSLYEYHKLLTYPRTDSRYLTDDMKSTIQERLQNANIFAYEFAVKKADIDRAKCFNNAKVGDHHAIIPTEIKAVKYDLTTDELKIYQLVVKRFIQAFLAPAKAKQVVISANIDDLVFQAKQKFYVEEGFKSIDDQVISQQVIYNANKRLIIKNVILEKQQTQSPSLLNEATLLNAMENPFNYFTVNKEEQRILKDTKGIGTVATRAEIIEKLFKAFLLEMTPQGLRTTSKGKQLLNLVPDDLKSPILTASWEEKFIEITNQKLPLKVFQKEINAYSKKMINEIIKQERQFIHDNLSNRPCPKCREKMLEVKTKTKEEILVCSNTRCKHKIRLKARTKITCPDCRCKLVKVFLEKENLLVCEKCGFRKKEQEFFKKKPTHEASKSDLKKYLNRDFKNETDDDNPFAVLKQLLDE